MSILTDDAVNVIK